MPARKPVRKNLVFDIGAGSGAFTRLLQERNPKDKVVGIDHLSNTNGLVRETGGSYFRHRLKEPERVKSVWANHINIIESRCFIDFLAIVEKVPTSTPFVLTMRKENLDSVRNALDYAGLRIRPEKQWSPKMLGSPYTKKFYKEALQGNSNKQPIRIVAVKPNNWIKPKDI